MPDPANRQLQMIDELKKATLVIVIFVTILGIVIGLMDTMFQFVFVKAVAKLF